MHCVWGRFFKREQVERAETRAVHRFVSKPKVVRAKISETPFRFRSPDMKRCQ